MDGITGIAITRFRHLPPVGQAIIIFSAVGVFAIVALTLSASYNAVYRLVGMLGLYGTAMTRVIPVVFDTGLLVAECAAILGGIFRAIAKTTPGIDHTEIRVWWPWALTFACGGATIGFNVWHAWLLPHAPHDPLVYARMAFAGFVPALMMLAFQVLLAIVKWTMLHLGRPLQSGAVVAPLSPAVAAAAAGDAELQSPRWARAQVGQSGPARGTLKERVQQHLRELDAGEVQALAAQGSRTAAARVTAALAEQGVNVSHRHVQNIVTDWFGDAFPRTSRKRRTRTTRTRRGR